MVGLGLRAVSSCARSAGPSPPLNQGHNQPNPRTVIHKERPSGTPIRGGMSDRETDRASPRDEHINPQEDLPDVADLHGLMRGPGPAPPSETSGAEFPPAKTSGRIVGSRVAGLERGGEHWPERARTPDRGSRRPSSQRGSGRIHRLETYAQPRSRARRLDALPCLSRLRF